MSTLLAFWHWHCFCHQHHLCHCCQCHSIICIIVSLLALASLCTPCNHFWNYHHCIIASISFTATLLTLASQYHCQLQHQSIITSMLSQKNIPIIHFYANCYGYIWAMHVHTYAKYEVTDTNHVIKKTLHIFCPLHLILLLHIFEQIWLSYYKYRSQCLHSVWAYRSNTGAHI